MEEPTTRVPAHLKWSGLAQSIELTSSDVEAMDIALGLVPELRLAALAVARARKYQIQYPITSTDSLERLLGAEGRLTAGGHDIDPAGIRRFIVHTDFPIEHEGALANVVYMGLMRCRQRSVLERSLQAFDSGPQVEPH